MRGHGARPAYSSNLDLFTLGESDISNSNAIYVPVYSQTNIKEPQVPLEFHVSNTFVALICIHKIIFGSFVDCRCWRFLRSLKGFFHLYKVKSKESGWESTRC